jgi:CheY-like chemotaxis protein
MTEPGARGPRVLLVDDDRANLAVLREVLESEGVEVVGEATDGEAALRLALELRPDVALIDLLMPVMDGLQATRRIREAELPTEVVILTFYDELLSEPADQAGAFAYLVKGCSVALMHQVIRQAWGRAIERQEDSRAQGGASGRVQFT